MSEKELIGAVDALAWTPSDTNYIPGEPRGFQVGVEGDVAVQYDIDSAAVVIPACGAGFAHAHNGFVRIWDTGTTASSIVILY